MIQQQSVKAHLKKKQKKNSCFVKPLVFKAASRATLGLSVFPCKRRALTFEVNLIKYFVEPGNV